MKLLIIISCFIVGLSLHAQNVGINNPTPGFPLNFAETVGDKISLYGNTGNHYGLGIQSALLQIHTDQAASNIAMGFGSSSSFTERMRLINRGGDGLQLNGRMIMKNGTAPLDPAYGSGLWLYKADNSSLLGFMGVQNNQNLGFYGGPAGWGFTYDAINSRVGINTNNPANQLDVGGGNNWDLVNGEGDMRIGTNSYRLKMGVALAGGGVGAAGIMQSGGIGALSIGANSKYLLTLSGGGNYIDLTNVSGGVRINGNPGNAGEVLTSNGNTVAPSWSPATNYIYNNSYKKRSLSFTGIGGSGNPSSIVVPDFEQSFTVARKVMAMISWNFQAIAQPCAFCGDVSLFTAVYVDGELIYQLENDLRNNTWNIQSGSTIVFIEAGTHTVQVKCTNFSSSITTSIGGNNAGVISTMNVVLFPQ